MPLENVALMIDTFSTVDMQSKHRLPYYSLILAMGMSHLKMIRVSSASKSTRFGYNAIDKRVNVVL